MRIPRVFCEQDLSPGLEIELDGPTAHYLGRVLRLAADHPVLLFNGDGREYSASILSLGKKSLRVSVSGCEDQSRSSPLKVHLGIGLSRGERMDWIVQKSTELGVDAITPLFSERCEVKLKGERADKKREHWRQISISACEQCQRNRLPEIHPSQSLSEWLAARHEDKKFILHPGQSQGLTVEDRPASIALLIGPEGGFEDGEVAQALAQQFEALSLGPRILRTETAPMAALSVMQYVWGDFAS